MKKRTLAALLAAAVGSGALCVACAPLRVATGYTSHVLCSGTFVSGLSPEQIYAEELEPTPGIQQGSWALHYEVDREKREVRSSIAGVFSSRAIYRDGLGCVVVRDDLPIESPKADVMVAAPDPAAFAAIGGPGVVEPRGALKNAIDREFSENAAPPYRHTKAVVVLSEGHLVAERYAAGYGVETPLHGWSMTKSVVNAWIGILVREGKLSVGEPAPVQAWRGAGDARRAITIDALLRNTSGLALEETSSGFDPSSQMVFLERDMAAFAEKAPLAAAPGQVWSYSSGNFAILSRIVRDAVKGRAEDVLRFARRELFDPIGMGKVTLEVDATGTPVGGSFMLASARDWARFGLLFASDGVAAGRRILPEGWVRYSSSPTLDSPYAAGFWRGRREWRARWGLPDDAFFASGSLGQRVVVIPSEGIVIARFGLTQMRPDFDADGLGRLVADIRSALGKSAGG